MDLKDVGRQLKLLRQAKGLTVREAAPLAGKNPETGRDEISRSMLNLIENGQNTTLATLDKIVVGLGGTLDIRIRPPRQADAPPAIPPADRLGIVKRVIDLMPRLTEQEADVLLGELRYLEREADAREGKPVPDDED
jgi:transcriptional regulator with XRE-family HTH domain